MVFYILLTPVAYFAGWLKSVTFVAVLSLWALALGALAAWRSDVPEIPEDKERGV
jgi:hypothetical protein